MTDVDAVATEADNLLLRMLLDPAGRKDPYPLYRSLRDLVPVHRSMMGVTVLTRHADCHLILRDHRCGKPDDDWLAEFPPEPGIFGMASAPEFQVAGEEVPMMGRSMLTLNPPDHTRLRGLVGRAFTPRRVIDLEPSIVGMLDDLLDAMAEKVEAEIMDDLAFRLPVAVIGELVGVPEEDRAQFRPLVRRATALIEPGASEDDIQVAVEAGKEIIAYFEALIAERRVEPQEDLLSALIAARDGEDQLTEAELLSTVGIIFLAGFETTTNLIGNGLYAMLTTPGCIDRFRSDPALDATAVDELLRWDSPVQLDLRVTFEDVELPGGEVIEAGQRVMTVLGAANRDPAVFDDPEQLDLARNASQLLSFAAGPHFCIGAALARAEGRIVFRRLVERFSSIELLDDDPPRRPGFVLRGFDQLPVRLRA